MKITARARSKHTGHAHTIADADVSSLKIEPLESGAVRITAATEKLALFGHYSIDISLSALEIIQLHTGSTVGFLNGEIARLNREMAALRAQMAAHGPLGSTPTAQLSDRSPEVRTSKVSDFDDDEPRRNKA